MTEAAAKTERVMEREITVSPEAYEELLALQIDEVEEGDHLCEDKARVVYRDGVEAGGALGVLLADFGRHGCSRRGHETSLGLFDRWGNTRVWDGLLVICSDDEGEEHHDEYRIRVDGGSPFVGSVKDADTPTGLGVRPEPGSWEPRRRFEDW